MRARDAVALAIGLLAIAGPCRAADSATDVAADGAGAVAKGVPELRRDVESRRDTGRPSHEALVAGMVRVVSAHLQAAGARSLADTLPVLQQALTAVLPARPGVLTADVDGDGSDDLVLSAWLADQVALIACRSADERRCLELVPMAIPWQDTWLYTEDRAPVLTAHELTGDGRTSIVAWLCCGPGTGHSERVYGWRWDGRRKDFAPILGIELSNWAGGSQWELRPGPNGTQELAATTATVGRFGHKLDRTHRSATEIWRWDAKAGRFVLASETISPPTTKRQAAGIGEDALEEGRYLDAVSIFTRVVTDESLADDDESRHIDWVAFAQLRLGLSQAMLGRDADARASFERARAAGGFMGSVAARVLTDYQGDDRVARAWAAVAGAHGADFHDAIRDSFRQPQLGVVAYLDATHATTPVDTRGDAARLDELGLRVDSLVAGDVDGDGREDVAFITSGRAWLVRHTAEGWKALSLMDLQPGSAIRAIRDDPDSTRGVVVIEARSFLPPLLGLSVDASGTLVTYAVVETDGELTVKRR